jgi:hypothetical protein
MKFHKALAWMPALCVLGGCPGTSPEQPPRLSAITVT